MEWAAGSHSVGDLVVGVEDICRKVGKGHDAPEVFFGYPISGVRPMLVPKIKPAVQAGGWFEGIFGNSPVQRFCRDFVRGDEGALRVCV